MARPEGHPKLDTPYPVDPSAFPLLWEMSTARPGIILRVVRAALDLAAEENRPVVTTAIIERVMDSPTMRSTGSAGESPASLVL